MKVCPHCQRPFAPDIQITGPVRARIYEFVSKHPEGVTRDQIADFVYRNDRDGGPSAFNTISVAISKLNKILASHLLVIHGSGGPGSIYSLCTLTPDLKKKRERGFGNSRAVRVSPLTAEQEAQVRDLWESGRCSIASLAWEYQVSQTLVARICGK